MPGHDVVRYSLPARSFDLGAAVVDGDDVAFGDTRAET
jgi:hypothetical protein